MNTNTLDLGCGTKPRNPFNATHVHGIDIRDIPSANIKAGDLVVDPIPFPSDFFDYVTAYDFIEHVPRVIYCPQRRFPFVELMNEIYRVLKPGGLFRHQTPAFPKSPAWRDPTHVNVITEETFPLYFDDRRRWASIYGFTGSFAIISQDWDQNGFHLNGLMKKTEISKTTGQLGEDNASPKPILQRLRRRVGKRLGRIAARLSGDSFA